MSVLYVRGPDGNLIPIKSISSKSAYEYARDAGYTGTEEEFAEALVSGAQAFVLTVTESEDGSYTVDKLLEDAANAHLSGVPVHCMLTAYGANTPTRLDCYAATASSNGALLQFTSVSSSGRLRVLSLTGTGTEVSFGFSKDDVPMTGMGIWIGDQMDSVSTTTGATPEVDLTSSMTKLIADISPTKLPNPGELTIDGQVYDGSVDVAVYTGSGASVKAYEAVGDGVSDDTQAFQTALAENRVVFVPGGTYVLNGTLTIEENCCLELSQDTVLNFTNTDANCIQMQRSACLTGNHATIFVPQAYTGHVLHVSTDVDETNGYDNNDFVPPWTMWDPQWKTARYVTDINICKRSSKGLNYSLDGTDISGKAVYINCDNVDASHYMWGVNMSGLRIAGAFTHGVHIINENSAGATLYAWNHELRLEAVIDACEIGVEVDHCDNGYISAVIEPRAADNGAVYAKHGIKLVASENVDMSGSRVWDWDAKNTLWTDGGECQHLAMYGDCYGAIINDYTYYLYGDTRDRIYTDTASNLERMTILQEPLTRWFRPINGVPYFNNGNTEQRLVTGEELGEYFATNRISNFVDALAISTDANGDIYNGVGYKRSAYFDSAGTEHSGSDYSYYVATGFIPAVMGDTIYTKNISFDFALTANSGSPDGSVRIACFDADKNPLGIVTCGNVMNSSGYYVSGVRTDDGLKITLNGGLVEWGTVAYVRFVFHIHDFGGDPIISVNEEITFIQEGFLADTVKVKGNNMYLYSPGGKTFTLTVDDNGSISATEVSE